VRFLVDENLSPQLCAFLTAGGNTAEHTNEVVGPGATDTEILAYATENSATVVTADTDFGALLARGRLTEPSVVLVRELLSLPVVSQGRLLAANLEQVREVLLKGAVVVFSLNDIRVRLLPIA
jgi:predicted nuclease of predicted toxin-antitoxin system